MQVNKITVIGAGSMGHQIAMLAALGDYETVLQDINLKALEAAKEKLMNLMNDWVHKGKITKKVVEEAFAKLKFTTDLELAVSNSDFIIEAIVEKLEVKQELFKKLDHLAKENAIFVTNSSTIVNSKIADATNRADKIANMHFFYPPLVMDCVEVVMSDKTTQNTADVTLEVCRGMGKKGFLLRKEISGFVANRLLTALQLEAMSLYEQGIADYKDIDSICRTALNHPMGPFQISDFSGIDIIVSVLQQLYNETLDDKYIPPSFLGEKVTAGNLGRKTGKGFYEYS